MSRICNSICNNSFANHVKLACTSDAGKQVGISSDYKKNKTERLGNFLLAPVRTVPSAINATSRASKFCAKGALNATSRTLNFCTKTAMNPQVIAVVLTAAPILVGANYIYPEQTRNAMSYSQPVVNFMTKIFSTVVGKSTEFMTAASGTISAQSKTIEDVAKFVAFAVSTATVVGVGMRYCGRIAQEQIKNAFYAKPSANTQVTQEV